MLKEYLTYLELYIVLFLHQTTTFSNLSFCISSCISYYSYIKPQPNPLRDEILCVVYRTIPTSNHNCRQSLPPCLLLYIVLFLHQTTTGKSINSRRAELYIVLFLHQTTTLSETWKRILSCISYYSYIKPQLIYKSLNVRKVVYRTIPTSNHNCIFIFYFLLLLYIVLFLHQTTTFPLKDKVDGTLYIVLFLHQTTTGRAEIS